MIHITIDELAVELSKVGKVDDGEVVKAQREIIQKPTSKLAHMANWLGNLSLYLANTRESVWYGNGYRQLSLGCGDAIVFFDKYHDHSVQVVRIESPETRGTMFSGENPIGKAARDYAMDNELDLSVMYDPGSRPCGARFQYLVPEEQRTDLAVVKRRTVAVNTAYKGLTAVLKKSADVLLREMRSVTEKRE